MAGKTDLGGLFLKLGLDLDKNSFETGNKMIDGLTTNFSKLMGMARNAAVVLAGTAIASGTVESATYKTAQALGISTESLDEWKAAAKIAGVNANSLVNSMGQLGSTLSHIQIDGRGLEEYSKRLQELGLGITDLKDKEGNWLKADAAYKKIIGKAQSDYSKANSDEERQLVITKVGDVLGGEAQGLFTELVRKNISIDELLRKADSTIFTTESDNINGQNFLTEFNTLRGSIESLSKLFGDDIARELTPAIQSINEWLSTNGESIKNALNKIAGITGDVVDAAVGTHSAYDIATDTGVTGFIKDTKSLFESEEKIAAIFDARKETKEIEKLIKKENQKRNGWKANLPGALKSQIAFEDLSPELQARMNVFAQNGGDLNYFRNSWYSSGSLKDGIMRPDGTITQVAPDDWVFAARNVGDLAKAFIPPMPTMAGGNNEFVINQTFNINGSSDLPQVLRQQAYQGTQDGLMQIMEQSSQRLQLMSGTR